jgi:hypothetical protein
MESSRFRSPGELMVEGEVVVEVVENVTVALVVVVVVVAGPVTVVVDELETLTEVVWDIVELLMVTVEVVAALVLEVVETRGIEDDIAVGEELDTVELDSGSVVVEVSLAAL